MAGTYVSMEGISEATAALSGLGDAFSDLTELHFWFVIAAQEHALDNYPTGPKLSALTTRARPHGGSKVLFDSGRLWRSITGAGSDAISTAEGSLNQATPEWAKLGSNLIYARLQQEGGTIRPVLRKYLAVPLTPQASKSEGPRSFGKPLSLWPWKSGDGYFLVEGETFRPTRGKYKGQERIRARQVADGRPVAHFMLTKEVKVPARPFLPKVADLIPILTDTTQRWIAHILKKKAA